VIYDGGTRSEAARLGNVTLQIVRDWVLRFNAEGPAGLRDRKSSGPTPRLTDTHRAALLEIIERGPTPAIHSVVRWRLCDLGQWLWEEFRVAVSPQTLSRELRAMGLRKISARPKHHAQAEGAIETFKKTSPPRWRVSPRIRQSASMPWKSGSPMRLA
jgi:transposase